MTIPYYVISLCTIHIYTVYIYKMSMQVVKKKAKMSSFNCVEVSDFDLNASSARIFSVWVGAGYKHINILFKTLWYLLLFLQRSLMFSRFTHFSLSFHLVTFSSERYNIWTETVTTGNRTKSHERWLLLLHSESGRGSWCSVLSFQSFQKLWKLFQL